MSAQTKQATLPDDEIEVLLIDFDSVKQVGDDSNPEVVLISKADGFFLNTAVADDFRIRKTVYDMLKAAQKKLPANYNFMVFEAYRPLARQVMLWNKVAAMVKEKYPDATPEEARAINETYTADPFNGIGSGHQACCAIDISLCDDNGVPYDMGTAMHEFNPMTKTLSDRISNEAKNNRAILVEALESEGLINYPAEWWHFSYGDHQWAYLLGKSECPYGPIDI
jgi:D-alanyl-D-alanine dipeptidase